MSDAVAVTVTFAIKPERAQEFVESLRGMFPVTRTRPGFRAIRLLRSSGDPHRFVLIEQWDSAQAFQDYMRFRTETGDTASLMEMTASPPEIAVWADDPLAEATV